ncbi:MAG: PilZ domain-containing protein [Bdellovibrionales bacterium]|nr:PilZ domain-containing protein [Bdellovibrionales bacterium]
MTRAPRLELGHLDNKEMYFALDSERGKKHSTQVANISETGLAFVAKDYEAPSVGEMIKVEFTVPGEGKMAWFARVVRVEEYYDARWWDPQDDFEAPSEVMVAVTYVDMPVEHKTVINRGLETRFEQIRKARFQQSLRGLTVFLLKNFWNFALFLLCVITTFAVLHLYSMRDPISGSSDDPFFEPKDNSPLYYILRGWDL